MYDEAGRLYDEAGRTYDDLEQTVVSLIVGAIGSESQRAQRVADRSLSTSANTHGNARATLGVTLINPAILPTIDSPLYLDVEGLRLFEGVVKDLETREYRGGHLFVTLQAQAETSFSGIPGAAPFALTEADPPGPGQVSYESLVSRVRTTEGGSPKTTYEATLSEHGAWAGMNIEVTSTNHGLVAEELAINEAMLSFDTLNVPRYKLVLGDPIVHLAQVVAEHEVPDGSITETKIADDSISTPKLQANAIVAKVANIGQDPDSSTVVIDASGIVVTSGAIEVRNPTGTVIIDGTSDMFKINVTGTLTIPASENGPLESASVTLTTGLDYRPMHLAAMESGGVSYPFPHILLYNPGPSYGHVATMWHSDATDLGGGQTQITGRVHTQGSTPAISMRYYVLQEAAI